MAAFRTLGGKPLMKKLQDEFRFFRNWIDSPLTLGAISPSGPELARRIASFLNVRADGRYLELGPGTGVVTQAIFDRGITEAQLTALEYTTEFCRMLRDRFPGMMTIQGDAYALRHTLEKAMPVQDGMFTGIVSGLPLFTQPVEKRRALILEALDLCEPGASFIQFSYALVPPVKPEPGVLNLDKTGWIFANLPPARVWVYTKPH
jgi:phosphatidylethanolamine/phosphatidyl-N-methylethanolamine N-methyltransferase